MIRVFGAVFVIWLPLASILCLDPLALFATQSSSVGRHATSGRLAGRRAEWTKQSIPFEARLVSVGLFTVMLVGGVVYAHHQWDLDSLIDG